jgi:hypothetical protein
VASDWAVVAGTGVGADSGLITLLLNRRYAARDRAEDRVWAVRQQNVDQRRVLYADLLRLARELEQAVDALESSLSMGLDGESKREKHREKADVAATAFEEVVAATEVRAVDRRVIDLATEIRDEAHVAIWKASSWSTRQLPRSIV